jgi:hypothetical protein
MPSTIIWHVTLECLIDVYRHFEGTYYLRLQGSRISQAAKINHEASYCILVTWFIFGPCSIDSVT